MTAWRHLLLGSRLSFSFRRISPRIYRRLRLQTSFFFFSYLRKTSTSNVNTDNNRGGVTWIQNVIDVISRPPPPLAQGAGGGGGPARPEVEYHHADAGCSGGRERSAATPAATPLQPICECRARAHVRAPRTRAPKQKAGNLGTLEPGWLRSYIYIYIYMYIYIYIYLPVDFPPVALIIASTSKWCQVQGCFPYCDSKRVSMPMLSSTFVGSRLYQFGANLPSYGIILGACWDQLGSKKGTKTQASKPTDANYEGRR